MDSTRTGTVLIVISLCIFSLGGWAGRPRKGQLRSDGGGSLFPGLLEIDEDLAEQLWNHCRLDLMQITEIIKVSEIFFLEEISIRELNPEVRSEITCKLQKAINSLSPQIKETLVDCLNKRNSFPLRISSEEVDGLQNWLVKHLEVLFRWPPERRILAEKVIVSPSSFTPSPSLAVGLPSFGPKPSPSTSPSASPGPSPTEDPEFWSFPPDPPDSPFVPPGGEDLFRPPGIVSLSGSLERENSGNSKKVVVIAVIVTAVGTSLFTAILFFCYTKCCRKKGHFIDALKDDRPLLTLSFSDFSVGSSQKSLGSGNPIDSDKFETLSVKYNQTINKRGSSLEMNSISSEVNIVKTSLPLPPAAVAAALEAAKKSKKQAPINHTAISSDETPPPPPVPVKAPPHPPPPLVPVKAPPHPPPPPFRSTSSFARSSSPSSEVPSSLDPGPPPNASPNAPPPPPPVASCVKPGPHPPPLPLAKGGAVLPRPLLGPKAAQSSCPGPQNAMGQGTKLPTDSEESKPKLKPFFWDKVLANPDHSMVWHQIKSGSFQFNEEMIESLFGYNNLGDKTKIGRKKETPVLDAANHFVQILDHKKSQNLSILLRALNVTVEEVCEALVDGNELPIELLETFLKMSPTPDEELRLRLYCGELSQLLPAERFLKALVDIPFAFKRIDALRYMTTLHEEVSSAKESFSVLEVACSELRSSRLFLKLLEAVLKTGNRMNDGTYRGGAQAFKLDTLLKLADVRGTDGKTTLLHFVVQEIIRSEGNRRARALQENNSISSLNSEDSTEDLPHETNDDTCTLGLQVVSGLSEELENVKRAAILDADTLAGTVANLGRGLVRVKEFLNKDMRSLQDESGFQRLLMSFIEHSEGDVNWLLQEERRIRALVKATTDYFHGSASKDEGLRLFVIVRDFLGMVDKVVNEVKTSTKKIPKTPTIKEFPAVPLVTDQRQQLFPAIKFRQRGISSSSSDDEG